MTDLLRWSEDCCVDWRRVTTGSRVYPQVSGFNDPQLRLALAYAVLAEHTGSKLQRAKAEALANAALVAQYPNGQIDHALNTDVLEKGISVGPGTNGQDYGTLALMRLAQFWEKQKSAKEAKP